MNRSNFLAVLDNRRRGYSFLARVYAREVDASFLMQLQYGAGEIDEVLEDFQMQLDGADLTTVARELATEYACLFLNMSASPVYPFESVYTSNEHLLMQNARDSVVEEYQQEGLDVTGSFKEPEDHIAIELEFMAYLCRRAGDVVKDGDATSARACLQRQKEFLQKHLLVWVPAFCDDLLRLAQSDFYRSIARLTQKFLEAERESIDKLLIEDINLNPERPEDYF
jgi:TorA maturation chaperone TorD